MTVMMTRSFVLEKRTLLNESNLVIDDLLVLSMFLVRIDCFTSAISDSMIYLVVKLSHLFLIINGVLHAAPIVRNVSSFTSGRCPVVSLASMI